jgi:hypothetical protein
MKGYRSMLPGLVLGLAATAALADPVGGDVDAISTLTSVNYVTNLDIVGASGLNNAVIVSGTINNNDENGWDLTVTSANAGKLQKGAGGAGRELVYTNITLVNTGGTLGAGLTNPSNTTRNVATGADAGDVIGTTHFFTHTQFTGTGAAQSATVDYTFELRISAAANTSLLSGTYTDTITLTLNNDS